MEVRGMKRIDVAILGATGMVGQKFVQLLAGHPYFRIAELFASEKSSGMRLEEATRWIASESIPDEAGGLKIKEVGAVPESCLVFSALPSDIAGPVEEKLAKKDKVVISKASANRMTPDVPLLVPEVNPEHLELLKAQRKRLGSEGAIITDPNCTTIGLVLALKPLQDAFGIREVLVTTMQAVSGAGLPGVPSLAIVGNIIPYIGGEEEKVQTEPLKILGRMERGAVKNAACPILASCHRVPVIDGHTESVHVRLDGKADATEARTAMEKFKGLPQELGLPSAPPKPVIVRDEEDRPQPRLDVMAGNGMSTVVGRLRQGVDESSLAFTLVSHNLVRGAAGAAVLDAELLVKKGMI